MNTARTTITLHPTLLARLKLYAKKEDTSVSKFVEKNIIKVLSSLEKKQENPYKDLFKLRGFAKADPEMKDKTVDEILYQ